MSQPHILFLTQHYPPEVAATGQLLAELAEDLIPQGVQVTVLAGRPSYGVNRLGTGVANCEQRNGVRVIRTYSTRFHRKSSLGRAANWISYPLSSLVRGSLGIQRPDLVVAYTAPPTTPPVGLLLALRWRARLVIYAQDIYPDIALAAGAIRVPLLAWCWRALNRFIYARADAVLALGDHMGAHLRQLGVPPSRIAVVHNWADGEHLHPVSNGDRSLRTALRLDGRFVVLFSGNLGVVNDFGPVREAMVRLRDSQERIAFIFVGDGVRRREMEAFVRKEGLEGLAQFRDYVPEDQLLVNLSLGDAGLLTALKGTEGLVVPSKLYTYLAMGWPILAVCHRPNEVTDIVQEARCGFVVSTGEELAGAVHALIADPSLRRSMGQRARAVFDARFERRQATARIGQILKRVERGCTPCQNEP